MIISHTNILATKLYLLDNGLKGTNFNINPQFFKKITKIDDGNYKIELSVSIKNTKTNPFPVEIEAIFETTFNFKEVENEQDVDTFLNVNAIQMIFPFMRAAINSLVSAALMPPLVLPIIDVRQFNTK
ncbi:MAG: protein-export chaperone SecB [Firmicutes bacterium]|nr:protein-export chaperone SecB [Bacillota bacterium]